MRTLATALACTLIASGGPTLAADGKHKNHKMGMKGHAKVGMLMISDAWTVPKMKAQRNTAAFLKIRNMGKSADRLVSITGKSARKFEIHTIKKHGGKMMMMKVMGGLAIPAGRTTELSPSGNHIMIMGLTRDLKKGSHIPLRLTFAKAGSVMVMVKVGTPKRGMKMDHSKHKHH